MFSISRLSIIALCSIILTSCVTDGVGRYRVQSIGNAQRSVAAIVLSANPVVIAQESSGAGANAGGALGGAMALDNSNSATALIAGIIAGAVVGDLIEANGNTYEGTEYVIESKTGLLLTVAQVNRDEEIFSKGDQVILVYGYPHRLIRDPR